ncbi:TonB C-terminal domain-containing protein [Novosphingobium decolorationis]|uniref:TonB C-terminal domain-containing protein n=1 Tax=Novosphingobium decolorationis TaxID=2698673 RepID=A0ABX8E3Y6_9SPHN|nr:TonB C-terminal domain-containing protein [Novosphingobium decolorationis]MED5545040.1 TonB C-terminal domain-containing protein [Pseudomonadota bacterium]QVM83648.1 TonB C-terminal domain-containing protein [Novosphingobium decolorationis]
MASLALRKDEGVGLVVAVVLHAGLLGVLLLRPAPEEIVPRPERIEVSISDEVGMTSTSPDPFSQAAPDMAPTLGEPAPEALPEPETPAEPAPAPQPEEPRPTPPAPEPKPKPAPKPAPKAKPKPKPEPAKAEPKPKAAPSRKSSAIDDIVSKPSAKPSTASSSKATSEPKKAGGSRVSSNFLDGVSGGTSESGSGAPAAAIGPKQVSALGAAIRRQLKPHWQAPQGADAELLVTKVRFRLKPDGTLDGEPQIVSTSGKTASNAAQVSRHQEQAIRAVKLAAPFNLPDDLYEGWKVVTTNFDRRL